MEYDTLMETLDAIQEVRVTCLNCGGELEDRGRVWWCPDCNAYNRED